MRISRRFAVSLCVVFALAGLAVLAGGWLVLRRFIQTAPRSRRVVDFIQNSSAHADWMIPAGQRCPGAPFQMPTSGFIGYVWDDSFQPFQRHSGLDIFGGVRPGDTPVYAASDGYLTRQPDWKSSVIVRLAQDPLQPGRAIWTYYTHMADPQGNSFIDPAFPPGTSQVFVKAGTLLGHMGNYSGTPSSPVGVHLHFSIVLEDSQGKFRDERAIANTLDPSPYFGMNLNANQSPLSPPRCR
jgi:murein DD-endopeptidase MepM/ murein hydrolase activator NlpD